MFKSQTRGEEGGAPGEARNKLERNFVGLSSEKSVEDDETERGRGED